MTNTALYVVDWGNILSPTVPSNGIIRKITHTGNSTTAAAAAAAAAAETETLTN